MSESGKGKEDASVISMYKISEFQVRCRDLSNSMQNTALGVAPFVKDAEAIPWHENYRFVERKLTGSEDREFVDTVKRKYERALRLCGWPVRVRCWSYYIPKEDGLLESPGDSILRGFSCIAVECLMPKEFVREVHRHSRKIGHPWGKTKLWFAETFEEARGLETSLVVYWMRRTNGTGGKEGKLRW